MLAHRAPHGMASAAGADGEGVSIEEIKARMVVGLQYLTSENYVVIPVTDIDALLAVAEAFKELSAAQEVCEGDLTSDEEAESAFAALYASWTETRATLDAL